MKIEDFQTLLGQEIKHIREIHEITRNQVFMETNVIIGRIEDGKVVPTLATYFKICAYFDIPLDDLLKNIEVKRKTWDV